VKFPVGWRAVSAALIVWNCLASTGRADDRALIIGIERYMHHLVSGTVGAEDDAFGVARLLQDRYGFSPDSIKVLINENATSNAIILGLTKWVVEGSKPGDRVFIFFSGHGNQLPDDDGDESDGWDETICPYDANPFNEIGQIRDDTIELIINKLEGRRVVLLFDSCHAAMVTDTPGPVPSTLPPAGPNPQSPDYVGIKRVAGPASLVVISASGSYQSAWPMIINGKIRGAASYAFELAHTQAGELPTLIELNARMNSSIERYHFSGRLSGGQEITVEAFPEAILGRPLFGLADPAVKSLSPPPAGNRITLAISGGKRRFNQGESLTCTITPGSQGYVYLLLFKRNQNAFVLFPNKYDVENNLSPGPMALPRNPEYAFTVWDAAGTEVLAALRCAKPLRLPPSSKLSWSEALDRIGSTEVAAALNGLFPNSPEPFTLPTLNKKAFASCDAACLTLEIAD